MEERIIVTGANHGIGLEICKSLLERNKKVIAISRSINNLEEINSDNLKIISADLTMGNKELLDFISNGGIKITGLVNNAGQLINKPFMETSDEEFKSLFDVNFFAVVRLIKDLIPHFYKAHIVNIGSMGGYQGSSKFPGLSAYSSSKAALMNLTELLAEELKEKDIVVNALALGAVQTKMLEQAFPGYTANTSPQHMGEYIATFVLEARSLYNGKILPLSNSTP